MIILVPEISTARSSLSQARSNSAMLDPPRTEVTTQGNLSDLSWALNSKGTLAEGLIRDYATYAHQAQYRWALKLTEMFYGKKATRNYFDGCSDGGRVSMMMAQLFPDDFDGIVVGAPTINFDRYTASTLYPVVAENIENHTNVPRG